MAQGWTPDEIALLNQIAKESIDNFVWGGIKPVDKGEEKVNTYEKTVIRNYMNIEYGAGTSIDQLTLAYGYFSVVADKIVAAGYDVPKELQTALDACKRDLDVKIRENRLKELRALELQRENFLTRSEKLGNIEAEIKRLKELTK